jgi:hypothetical protein
MIDLWKLDAECTPHTFEGVDDLVGRRPERRSGSGRILSSLSIIQIETLRNKIMEPYELGIECAADIYCDLQICKRESLSGASVGLP